MGGFAEKESFIDLDGFSMEASFVLCYTGLYGNSGTSRNTGILPSKILSQIPDQKISPWQDDQPKSSTVELVESRSVMAGHIYM